MVLLNSTLTPITTLPISPFHKPLTITLHLPPHYLPLSQFFAEATLAIDLTPNIIMLSFFDIHYNLLFLVLYVYHLTVSFGQMPCGIWMIRLIQPMEENS
jgi:hypothetical protein